MTYNISGQIPTWVRVMERDLYPKEDALIVAGCSSVGVNRWDAIEPTRTLTVIDFGISPKKFRLNNKNPKAVKFRRTAFNHTASVEHQLQKINSLSIAIVPAAKMEIRKFKIATRPML